MSHNEQYLGYELALFVTLEVRSKEAHMHMYRNLKDF